MENISLTREEALDRAAARVARRAQAAVAEGRGGLSSARARKAMKPTKNKGLLGELDINLAAVLQHALGKGWIVLQGDPGPTPPGVAAEPGRIIPGPIAPPTGEESRTAAAAAAVARQRADGNEDHGN